MTHPINPPVEDGELLPCPICGRARGWRKGDRFWPTLREWLDAALALVVVLAVFGAIGLVGFVFYKVWTGS